LIPGPAVAQLPLAVHGTIRLPLCAAGTGLQRAEAEAGRGCGWQRPNLTLVYLVGLKIRASSQVKMAFSRVQVMLVVLVAMLLSSFCNAASASRTKLPLASPSTSSAPVTTAFLSTRGTIDRYNLTFNIVSDRATVSVSVKAAACGAASQRPHHRTAACDMPRHLFAGWKP
jgi:hypothetical protein